MTTKITLNHSNNFKAYIQAFQQIGILFILCILFTTSITAQPFVKKIGADNPFNGVDEDKFVNLDFIDIDNDGDFDAFIGEIDGVVHYYKNTGTATSPVFVKQANSANPLSLVSVNDDSSPSFVDIDNDGDFDVFSGELYGDFYYYKNTGSVTNPTFVQKTGFNNPFDFAGLTIRSNLTFADMDNDGDFDALGGAYSGETDYYENIGSATNPNFVEQISGPFDVIEAVIPGVTNGESYPTFVDFDGDGDFDVFVGKKDGNIDYFENTGTASVPAFTQQTGANNPFDGHSVSDYATPKFVDIDNDGDFDVFVGKGNGKINFYENTAPVLPVELTYFKGQTTAEGNLLTWQTASEKNNKGFEVQHSVNGEEWETIDFVQGNGTTLETQNYTFTDYQPLNGRNYYRLKQMDFDGAFEYSDVISIENNSTTVEIGDFYPNPSSSGLVNLDFTTSDDNEITLSVFDITGKLMINQVQQVTQGNNQLNFDFSTLNKGIYLVKIGNENKAIMRKLIIE